MRVDAVALACLVWRRADVPVLAGQTAVMCPVRCCTSVAHNGLTRDGMAETRLLGITGKFLFRRFICFL